MSDERADQKAVSVLIVSDDPVVRAETRFGFPAHISVAFAVDSREAARTMRDLRPEPGAVVVDMQTGNAGGFALVREMSESSAMAPVPVLILLERPQDVWIARKSGATAHAIKPVAPDRLASQVLSLLR